MNLLSSTLQNTDFCFFLLKLKMQIQNFLRWILRKIYVTKSVEIIDNGRIRSVYWRYIIMYIVLTFKFLLIEKIYNWCCTNIDIETPTVQIVKNINYVDRYVIYENDDNKNAIQNTINYMKHNETNMQEITLPKNIIFKCELRTKYSANDAENNKEEVVDLKKLFSVYATESINNHTIKNVLLFNSIKYDDTSRIYITMSKNRKRTEVDFNINEVLNKKILDLYA